MRTSSAAVRGEAGGERGQQPTGQTPDGLAELSAAKKKWDNCKKLVSLNSNCENGLFGLCKNGLVFLKRSLRPVLFLHSDTFLN
jgi:hypothetical protein